MDEKYSDSSATRGQYGKLYVYLVSLVSAVGGFIFGFDMVIMSGAIIFLKKEFNLNANYEGFAMSNITIGCIIGLIIGGRLCDWIGRKMTLIAAASLFAASAIGTAIPETFFTWSVYRIIGGIGGGLACMVSPMYIAEISPAAIRGRLVTLNQLAIVIGCFSSNIIAYLLAFQENWRWMFASELFPIALLVIGICFIPRSPRWLVQKNRLEEAKRVLVRIDGPAYAEKEILEIQESLTYKMESFFALFRRGIRMATLIAVALAFFQQFGGVSTMIFYAPTIFQQAGVSVATEAIGQTIILNSWNVFCTILALWLIEKIGRRPLLLFGTAGMALGQFLMGMVFKFSLSGVVSLIVMFLGVGAYVMSLAPLAWLIMSEVFPTRIRARGMALGAFVIQISFAVVNWTFPTLVEYFNTHFATQAGVFWLYALICLLAFIFSWRLVPETKGRTLEEISLSWLKSPKPS